MPGGSPAQALSAANIIIFQFSKTTGLLWSTILVKPHVKFPFQTSERTFEAFGCTFEALERPFEGFERRIYLWFSKNASSLWI